MAIRIIGGTLGGRKLVVPDSLGLRPTGDRVRETLFNWLQAYIPGSTCLDLFSGSGSLGLEALSRGALQVIALEKNRKVFEVLQALHQAWGLSEAYNIIRCDAFEWLERPSNQKFDCIFIDPPFQLDCLTQVINLVSQNNWLTSEGLLYVERPKDQILPIALKTFKERQAGMVIFGLYRFDKPDN